VEVPAQVGCPFVTEVSVSYALAGLTPTAGVGLDVVDPWKLRNGVRTWCKRAWGTIAGF